MSDRYRRQLHELRRQAVSNSLKVMYLAAAILGFVFLAGDLAPAAATSGTLTITSDTTLTEDHSGNIVIGMDSVRLDCASHAILGDGSGAGLTLVGRTGVDVRNCVITGADEGIKLVGSSRNSFWLNEISNNSVGVSVESQDVWIFNRPSQGNEFRGNQVKNNDNEGFAVRDSHWNLFHANAVEANGRDGFDLYQSNNNAILANRVSLNGFNGIELDKSNNNVLNDNFSSQNGHLGNRSGFSLDISSENAFTNNFADDNRRNGYRLTEQSHRNMLQSNSACRNGEAAIIVDPTAGDVYVDSTSVGNVYGDTRCDPIVDPILPGG